MIAQDHPQVVVVVPTYNEKESLPVLIEDLLALPQPNLQVLVVDDNSPDGTGDVADRFAAESGGQISVLHRNAKDGLGRAYVAGFSRAVDEGADVVIQMDADLSHPVTAIPAMLEVLRTTDAGVVIGSRYVPGGSTAADWPWTRKVLSSWANLYVNAILRLHIKDATAGFKAWRASTLRDIDLASIHSNGYSFQVEMNYRATRQGHRIAEVPIRFVERVKGASKMNARVQLESAIAPWQLLWQHRSK
ncbi:MAG: putative polyprenol-phosphate mannosyltransferase [Frankiales bacterium]|nr:putative polyprenol-phosphate mannosyltransferase [Frankiales bacterium]